MGIPKSTTALSLFLVSGTPNKPEDHPTAAKGESQSGAVNGEDNQDEDVAKGNNSKFHRKFSPK